MKKVIFLLVIWLFLLTGVGFAQQTWTVNLEWDRNTESDLAGYRLYASRTTFNNSVEGLTPIQDIPATDTTTTHQVPEGITYFVLTAYDLSGNESNPPSNEVSINFDNNAPRTPVLLHINEWSKD